MSNTSNQCGTIIVKVVDELMVEGALVCGGAVAGARVVITQRLKKTGVKKAEDEQAGPQYKEVFEGETEANGYLSFETDPGYYQIKAEAFGVTGVKDIDIDPSCTREIHVPLGIGFKIHTYTEQPDCRLVTCDRFPQGMQMVVNAVHVLQKTPVDIIWDDPAFAFVEAPEARKGEYAHVNTNVLSPGEVVVKARLTERGSAQVSTETRIVVLPAAVHPISGRVEVQLQRSPASPTDDKALWVAIRNRTGAISFPRYKEFIDDVLCQGNITRERDMRGLKRKFVELGPHARGVGAYDLLKTATEVFLLLNCGVRIEIDPKVEKSFLGQEERRLGEVRLTLGELKGRLEHYLGNSRLPHIERILPYIERILRTAYQGEFVTNDVFCFGVLLSNIDADTAPCLLELIWSYWQEEGMLVQTLNAISLRFQNRRWGDGRDPLGAMEIDPLRPLNNLLWGYIQDEINRLSVQRRAYEYDHQYGLSLQGRAIPTLRTADSRSHFLEAFHNLLRVTAIFFKEDDDTTVISDGFPVLNALKECHLVLSYGAHNQFGDLPWTARVEMLTQQWLLARPEMRDYLQSRFMVPYKETWMPQVDTMKKLQEWIDVSVTHFHDLAVFGEQLLLSIRYGDWSEVIEAEQAKNWARYWRPEIQGYIHAYRVVTSVDLGIDLTKLERIDTTPPSIHLARRLQEQLSPSAQLARRQEEQVSPSARLGRRQQEQLPSSVPLARRLEKPLLKR